ncbi:MAG: GIY-YIG nuclease family protein [Thermodesulfobacteriota bacterium]
MSFSSKQREWFVYIVRCRDKSLYTGIAIDLEQRIAEHNSGSKGAKYTRSRRPVTLVFYENHPDRSSAAKREAQIKKLSPTRKKALVNTGGESLPSSDS